MPSTLTLDPGEYWAAWQVDTQADVPSYTQGAPGDGFSFMQPFGPAPATLTTDEITLTDERWTQYVVYTVPETSDLWFIY